MIRNQNISFLSTLSSLYIYFVSLSYHRTIVHTYMIYRNIDDSCNVMKNTQKKYLRWLSNFVFIDNYFLHSLQITQWADCWDITNVTNVIILFIHTHIIFNKLLARGSRRAAHVAISHIWIVKLLKEGTPLLRKL